MSGATPNDYASLRDYYRRQYGVPRAVVIGPDRGFRITRAYGVNQLGTTLVIDRKGRLRWRGVWGGDTGTLFPAIEEAAGA